MQVTVSEYIFFSRCLQPSRDSHFKDYKSDFIHSPNNCEIGSIAVFVLISKFQNTNSLEDISPEPAIPNIKR